MQKYKKILTTTSSIKTIKESVPEFETPITYQVDIPDGYTTTEIPPPGNDFMVGYSYTECIYSKDAVRPDNNNLETCPVSICSMPSKVLELNNLKKKLGAEASTTYNKNTFAGFIGYEILLIPSGYRIIFFNNKNYRTYFITAVLMDKNDPPKSLAEMLSRLTKEQKTIIDSFKIIN